MCSGELHIRCAELDDRKLHAIFHNINYSIIAICKILCTVDYELTVTKLQFKLVFIGANCVSNGALTVFQPSLARE